MVVIGHVVGPERAVPGMRLLEHRFDVPLDEPGGPAIEIFAREVRAASYAGEDRPYLLMLNGGPGQAAQRPLRAEGGWLQRALEEFHVVLLDQRGTGLSSPITRQTLPPGDEVAQADLLKRFRADAIVRDAEHVRRALIGDRPWSVLGQSFGGFASLTYLSFAPDGLAEVFITGGLPPLDRTADDVYRATFARLDGKIAEYYERYPDDRGRWQEIFAHVATGGEWLPRGRELTVRGLKTLGHQLGMSTGREQLHYLAERAFTAGGLLSDAFLEGVDARISHALNPLYVVLHEAIYAQGDAPRWAAQRVLEERSSEPDFYGEMVFPWMFEEDPALAPFAAAADVLERDDDWPALYDLTQLGRNRVPVAAAVYLEDLYVESQFSLETARAVRGLRTWTTDEFDHDGVHVAPVLDRLIALARGDA